MPIVLLVRAWLGSLFVYSAALKLMRYQQARCAVSNYRILPKRLGNAAGAALPWAETLAGLSLLFGKLYPFAPLLGVLLGSSFSYGSFDVVRRRANVPCGCTGGTEERVDRITVGRAVAITFGNLLVLGAGRRRYVHLPLPVMIALSTLSLLPAISTWRHGVRNKRLGREHAMQLTARTEDLTRLLETTPSEFAVEASTDRRRMVLADA